MTLPIALALVALSLADPSGDAFGDGTLTPPTAPIYANAAALDIQSVDLETVPSGTRLSVTLGSLGGEGGGASATADAAGAPADDAAAPTDELAAGAAAGAEAETAPEADLEVPLVGFVPTVVDVYVGADGRGDTTLSGPGLFFPQGSGWRYAVRITSDGAFMVTFPDEAAPHDTAAQAGSASRGEAAPADADVDGTEAGSSQPGGPRVVDAEVAGAEVADPSVGDPEQALPTQAVGAGSDAVGAELPAEAPPAAVGAETDALPRLALPVYRRGSSLVVYLPVTVDADVQVQAMAGVYDPFSPTGWRPLAATPSPWAFSGAEEQVSPVVDLLARDADAQRAALRTGVLPRVEVAAVVEVVPWLYVMGAGVLLALFGLLLRGRVRPPAPVVAGGHVATQAAVAVGEEVAPATTANAADGGVANALDDAEDEDDELYDPLATAADVLAAEVAAADEAGAVDQDLLVDDTEELVLDTGEREAALAALALEEEGASAPAEPEGSATTAVEHPAEAPSEGAPSEALLALPAYTEGTTTGAGAEEPVSGPTPEPNDAIAPGTAGADVPPPAEADALGSAPRRDPFGTQVEATFLLPIDDPRAVEDFLAQDGDEESFWHPRARPRLGLLTDVPPAAPGPESGPPAPEDADGGEGG